MSEREQAVFLATVHPTANWLGMDAQQQTKLVFVVDASEVAQVLKIVRWTQNRLKLTVEVDDEAVPR